MGYLATAIKASEGLNLDNQGQFSPELQCEKSELSELSLPDAQDVWSRILDEVAQDWPPGIVEGCRAAQASWGHDPESGAVWFIEDPLIRGLETGDIQPIEWLIENGLQWCIE